MRQPWERPSLVREGDPDPNHTYFSVGRVLSQWEGVEIQLGYVYTAAVGRLGDWWALLEYGEGRAFLGRFNILKAAISNLFVRLPNQEVEGKLDCFLIKVNDFAARRHDVAHGIVRDRGWANWRLPHDPGDTTGYFLLPSHYKGRAYDSSALPTYAYTAQSMEALRHHLIQLETEAMGIAQLVNRHVSDKAREGYE
ncbi:hypothetical protein SAMN05444169_6534 [Bradyrhizobium erythrophlei]|uniref:Cthe-2314-like HEPN domain-containing protein n=1 Tax=Bradyrhizobium erythrophlei TaxID=1437360 RepID=A0A1M5RGS1_9BRAD|nr:hypothetical protein SAMN05444169_6534 [Bradyrhizobium erythrophlei]